MDIAQVDLAPRLFTRLLQAPARGLALFNPRKYNDEHESLRGGDIGDCGYMAEGQFHRLFNVFDPTPHPFPALKKPKIAPELRLNPRFPISTSRMTRFDISGNAANQWNPGLELDVQFAISKETTSAAILVFAGTKHQVTQYMETDRLRYYINDHEKAIRQYFRHTIGTLMIIYETTRTSGWFNDVRWLESFELKGQVLFPSFFGIGAHVHDSVTDINNTPIRVTAEGPAEDFDQASTIYTSVIRVVVSRAMDRIKRLYFRLSTRATRPSSDVNPNAGPTDLSRSGSHADTPEQGSSTWPTGTQMQTYTMSDSELEPQEILVLPPPTEEELRQVRDAISHNRDIDDTYWATYGPQNVLEEILDWILLSGNGIDVAIGDWIVVDEYIERFKVLPDETSYKEISIQQTDRGCTAYLVALGYKPKIDLSGTLGEDFADPTADSSDAENFDSENYANAVREMGRELDEFKTLIQGRLKPGDPSTDPSTAPMMPPSFPAYPADRETVRAEFYKYIDSAFFGGRLGFDKGKGEGPNSDEVAMFDGGMDHHDFSLDAAYFQGNDQLDE